MTGSLDALVLTAAALFWFAATAALLIRQGSRLRLVAAASTLLFAAAIAYASNLPALFAPGVPAQPVSSASLTPSIASATMSCSEIRTGMKGSQLTAAMGKPDRVLSAEDRRGPTAQLWIWDEVRCRVYIFEGNVDFVE